MVGSFEYDKEEDVFYIYNSDLPKIVCGSIVCGDVVFDISGDGEVVGMQIEGASDFFGFSLDVFDNISEAGMKVMTQGNAIVIDLLFV
ncbi:MAG: DUF2283 domain-containing protein [Nanoarchaeota archaeon]|nr:DUF2283 domain-containing protein [Nanoarchaeota archaeon]